MYVVSRWQSSRALRLCRLTQPFNLPQPFAKLVSTGERLGPQLHVFDLKTIEILITSKLIDRQRPHAQSIG
jgi:hypothetical protein